MTATQQEIGWIRGKLLKDTRFIARVVGKNQRTKNDIFRFFPSDDPGFGELFLRGTFIDVPLTHKHLVDTEAVQEPKWIMPDEPEKEEEAELESKEIMEDKQIYPKRKYKKRKKRKYTRRKKINE